MFIAGKSTASTSSQVNAHFHTTSPSFQKFKTIKSKPRPKDALSAKDKERIRIKRLEGFARRDAQGPHIILGTTPRGELTNWPKCELAKAIVTPAELQQSHFDSNADPSYDNVAIPERLSYGVQDKHKPMLFGTLPRLNMAAREVDTGYINLRGPIDENPKQTEFVTSSNFAKAIDLRNSNAKTIAFVNKQRIVENFGSKPDDTGRPEVQGVYICLKISKALLIKAYHLLSRNIDYADTYHVQTPGRLSA